MTLYGRHVRHYAGHLTGKKPRSITCSIITIVKQINHSGLCAVQVCNDFNVSGHQW